MDDLTQPTSSSSKADSDSETTNNLRPETNAPGNARRNGGGKVEDLPETSRAGGRSGAVRTSARVIQKMRLDNRPCTPPISSSNENNNNSQGTTIASNLIGHSVGNGVSSLGVNSSSCTNSSAVGGANGSCASSNGAVSTSTAVSSTVTAVKAEKAANAPRTPTTTKQTKRMWSNMERSLFFEALNEYGKDFEAITQHINQKMRRKVLGTDTAACKSKEQVRHLYLTTFQKASRYLRFSEGELKGR